MTQWEYDQTAFLTFKQLMDKLDKYGEEGWELAAVIEVQNRKIIDRQYVGILKKSVEEAA